MPYRQRDAVLEPHIVAHGVDQMVDPRFPLRICSGEAGQAECSSFD
jgi:hypothetical protein